MKALRTRRQVWRNSFGRIQGQGQTARRIPSPLPDCMIGASQQLDSCGWPEAGGWPLLRSGGHLRAAHAPFHRRNSMDYCSVLHRSASSCISQQTKHATQHLAQLAESFSLPRCNDSISHQYCLSGSLTTPARSRILGSQTAKAPRPCSWQLVTLLHWDSAQIRSVNATPVLLP